MWPKKYRDYPPDKPLVRHPVESGKGIVGWEMHDLNGWGEEVHEEPHSTKPGFLQTLFSWLFGT